MISTVVRISGTVAEPGKIGDFSRLTASLANRRSHDIDGASTLFGPGLSAPYPPGGGNVSFGVIVYTAQQWSQCVRSAPPEAVTSARSRHDDALLTFYCRIAANVANFLLARSPLNDDHQSIAGIVERLAIRLLRHLESRVS